MVAQPLHVTSVELDEVGRAEFIRGAEELGLNTERKPIQPQQFVIADVLQAPPADDGDPTVAVCVPRRASKTTTIFGVAVGRCINREDYQVAFTAQTGQKARERFLKDLVAPLERRYGVDNVPFKINRGRGSERIVFPNGSALAILPPIPDNFRGDAYDMVIVDEAQEHGPDLAQELLGAILPTFDTRPGAQLVVAGTAGKYRSGLLWQMLEMGRVGKVRIVEYAAPDGTDVTEYDNPEFWLTVHPGIGTLTTVAAVQRNHDAMSVEAFGREYLGIWPTSGSNAFVNLGAWSTAGVDDELPQLDEVPPGVGLAVSVHPDQSCASVAVAWRSDGVAHLLLVDHRPGVDWVAERAAALSRKLRVPIVHDSMGPVLVQAEMWNRMRPRPNLVPQNFVNVSTAAALFMKDNEEGNIRHWNQDRLSAAVRVATKRGTPTSNRWAFGRKNPDEDITPLEASSLALRYFDEKGGRPRLVIPKTRT